MSTFVITTCNAEGWQQTGRRMVETFARFWPADVHLLVYTEGFECPLMRNVRGLEFPQWFVEWKKRHALNPDAHGLDYRRNRPGKPYDFRRDCVKFAHKIAAITTAALYAEYDLMVWMDADTLTHRHVDETWLRSLMFDGQAEPYMAWLDRRRLYPECGFLLFNCRHRAHRPFMTALRDLYESDRVFDLSETHDSYVLQQLVRQWAANDQMPEPVSLSGAAAASHHPFPLSELGSRLDHAKGPRKKYGRTPRHELQGKRREEYWR